MPFLSKKSQEGSKRVKIPVNLSINTVHKTMFKNSSSDKNKSYIYRAYGSRKLQYIFTEQRSYRRSDVQVPPCLR